MTAVPLGTFCGLATLDLIYYVEHIPARDEKLKAEELLVFAGGPAANAAVTFSLLGGEATLITKLGQHPLATMARQELENCGVTVVDMDDAWVGPPPVSSTMVDRDGFRAVVSRNDGAFTRRAAEHGAASRLAAISSPDVCLMDGHHLNLAEMLMTTLRRQSDALVVLDGGSRKPGFESLCAGADSVIVSSAFCGNEQPEAVMAELLDAGATFVAVSRGHEPLVWRQGSETGSVDVPVVAAVDTLAAGDVLHGAFSWFRSQGLSQVESLKAASLVAARSCEFRGPREGVKRAANA